MHSPPRIEVAPAEWAGDGAVVSDLVEVVNTAYARAESGMWRPGTVRVSAEEMKEFLRRSEIAVARMDGRIAGCVRAQRLDSRTWGLGMLTARIARQGRGIGRALVEWVEAHAVALGADVMQLELLVPIDGSQASKVMLSRWYTRLGYEITGTVSSADHLADLSDRLIVPCECQIWRKQLLPTRT